MSVGDRLFYLPTKQVYGRPETHGLRYESIVFDSTDGVKLHGWFFPAEGEARGTVLHCHGNAGNMTGHFEHVRWLPARGWNVLCFDYRGYGESSGSPTRQGTIDDALAALKMLRSRSDLDGGRIVVLGQSLGGAVAVVAVAMDGDVRGLIVDGGFSHYRREASFVAQQSLIMKPIAGFLSRAIISEGLDPIEWVGKIGPIPKLFVCGVKDRIVDYRQTVALHDAAGEPKWLHVIEEGGHVDSTSDDEGRDRFAGFFGRCVE